MHIAHVLCVPCVSQLLREESCKLVFPSQLNSRFQFSTLQVCHDFGLKTKKYWYFSFKFLPSGSILFSVFESKYPQIVYILYSSQNQDCHTDHSRQNLFRKHLHCKFCFKFHMWHYVRISCYSTGATLSSRPLYLYLTPTDFQVRLGTVGMFGSERWCFLLELYPVHI